MNVPQFTVPLRLSGLGFAVNEQDSLDDVVSCVSCVLRYRPGEREMLPGFGSPELTFDTQPVGTAGLKQAIATWEPRAIEWLEEHPDAIDPLVDHIILNTGTADPGA